MFYIGIHSSVQRHKRERFNLVKIMKKEEFESIIDREVNRINLQAQKGKKSPDDIIENIRKRDSKKGNHKTEAEKKENKSKKENYISDYNKQNYVSTTLLLKPEDRVLLEVQSELTGESFVQYLSRLIKQDSVNFSSDEVKVRYEEKMQLIRQSKEVGKTLAAALNQEKTKKKQEMINQISQEAKEYFGVDPLTLPKTERLKFILYKTDYGNKKGNIQAYCDAMEVSRAWYYKKVKSRQ